jgi:hypothetical protein
MLKHRQKQITLDKFFVRQKPSKSQAESSGAKREIRERGLPFQTITRIIIKITPLPFPYLTTFP